MEPINTPFIRDRIKTAHATFKEAVGSLPSKISDDHKLLLTRMEARVASILDCFIKEGIIDSKSRFSDNVEGDLFYSGYKLEKKGFGKRILVLMDGRNISMKTPSLPSASGLNFGDEPYECIRNIDLDTYNWVEFVDRLLYFIHGVIYQRRESYAVKIFGSK